MGHGFYSIAVLRSWLAHDVQILIDCCWCVDPFIDINHTQKLIDRKRDVSNTLKKLISKTLEIWEENDNLEEQQEESKDNDGDNDLCWVVVNRKRYQEHMQQIEYDPGNLSLLANRPMASSQAIKMSFDEFSFPFPFPHIRSVQRNFFHQASWSNDHWSLIHTVCSVCTVCKCIVLLCVQACNFKSDVGIWMLNTCKSIVHFCFSIKVFRLLWSLHMKFPSPIKLYYLACSLSLPPSVSTSIFVTTVFV